MDTHARDPHRAYKAWLEAGPVEQVEFAEGLRVWVVTRHNDVLDLLRSDAFTRDWRSVPNPANRYGVHRYPEDYFAATPTNLFNSDGADHSRLYRLTMPYFAKPRVETLRPLVADIVDRTLDRLLRQTQADLVADFAVPVPLAVTGHVLGVPEPLLPAFAQHLHVVSGWLDPMTPQWRRSSRSLHRLALQVIASNADSDADCLIASLMRAHRDQQAISKQEIAAMIVILMGTGYETTAALLANGGLAMIADEPFRHRLETGPETTVDQCIDELLRFEPPSPWGQLRLALRDVTLAGADVKAGDLVYPLLAAANRDPLVHAEPDRFTPDRPNNHLSFGHGRRRCLGAELARVVARVALPALAQRASQLTLARPREELDWHGILHVRILRSLPVLCAAAGPFRRSPAGASVRHGAARIRHDLPPVGPAGQ